MLVHVVVVIVLAVAGDGEVISVLPVSAVAPHLAWTLEMTPGDEGVQVRVMGEHLVCHQFVKQQRKISSLNIDSLKSGSSGSQVFLTQSTMNWSNSCLSSRPWLYMLPYRSQV